MQQLVMTKESNISGQPEASCPAVLVVDDDGALREFLAKLLRREGYSVLQASDGEDAWGRYQQAMRSGAVAAVLTDYSMPNLDGLGLAARIREMLPSLPIAMVTAHGEKHILKQAMQVGINDFAEKPCPPNEIVGLINGLMARIPDPKDPVNHGTAWEVRRTHANMAAVNPMETPIHVYSEPLGDAGGDSYRQWRRPNGALVFMVADVAGHSVESSYALAAFLGAIAVVQTEHDEPREMLDRLNKVTSHGPFPHVPVAACIGVWTPWNGRLHLANAGMPPSVLYRKRTDAASYVRLTSPPVGMLPEARFREHVLFLGEGDRLLITSDGMSDASNVSGPAFSEVAVECWRDLAREGLEDAVVLSAAAARSHAGGILDDDLLAVGIEQHARQERSGALCIAFPSTLEGVDDVCARFKAWIMDRSLTLPNVESRVFDVMLCLREALVNAVLHGNRRNPARFVHFHCAFEGNDLRIGVGDEGKGIVQCAQEQPAAEPALSEGKRGLTILHELCDGISIKPGEIQLRFAWTKEDA